MKNKTYRSITLACFVGIFMQATITYFFAILFVPMSKIYGFSYIHLGIIVGVNFAFQILADITMSVLIDKLSFKTISVISSVAALVGMLIFAVSPLVFPKEAIFAGILVGTAISAFASGQLEVILSPIIDAIPNENKGGAMALMHSFYAWGQIITIIITSLAVNIFGGESWNLIALAWAVLPLVCLLMFSLSKYPQKPPMSEDLGAKSLILHPYYIVAMIAILTGGASEVILNQWVSSFMETALSLPKLVGDLVGMCGFAFMMGLARLIYGLRGDTLDMNKILIYGSALSLVCYVTVAICPAGAVSLIACALCGLASGLLWPGTLVIASDRFKGAGSVLFAVLAIAGDVGAGSGSFFAGVISDNAGSGHLSSIVRSISGCTADQAPIRAALLVCGIFPAAAFVCHLYLKKHQKDI